jgi:hypothetical protein
MGVLRLDDVGPDGVRLIVDWDTCRVGDSVFIPCVNVVKAHKQVAKIFARRQWTFRIHVCTEHNILGVRIWRTS